MGLGKEEILCLGVGCNIDGPCLEEKGVDRRQGGGRKGCSRMVQGRGRS